MDLALTCHVQYLVPFGLSITAPCSVVFLLSSTAAVSCVCRCRARSFFCAPFDGSKQVQFIHFGGASGEWQKHDVRAVLV